MIVINKLLKSHGFVVKLASLVLIGIVFVMILPMSVDHGKEMDLNQ